MGEGAEGGGEKEASKTEIAIEDCSKIDLKEWVKNGKRATDRRNWRLLIENVLRER